MKRPSRVELLALRHRIEDAKPRLRIAAGRGGPLPAAVVGGEVVVVQVHRRNSASPRRQSMPRSLVRKLADHHAQAVVHVAGLVDLRHRRVDQRVAGAALAPGGESASACRAVLPADAVVLRLEGVRRRRADGGAGSGGRSRARSARTATPRRRRPRRGAAGARGRRRASRADRDRAEAQVHRQVARALDRRKVARACVVVDALQEVVEQRVRRRRCRSAIGSACRLVGSKPSAAERRHARCAMLGRARRARLAAWRSTG